MYCSLDKIDLAARVDGKPVAIQADQRRRAEIEAEPELTALFAMARIVNARGQLAEEGHPGADVHYVVAEDPPGVLREALAAAGGTIERADKRLAIERLGRGSQTAVGDLADRCFAALAQRVKVRVGSRDLAIALRMLEDQTYADPPEREDDEARYWHRVLELAALAGELLRAKYPGRWIQTDRAMVPFGFELSSGSAVMFPTNRAQRVIEDGPDESLFKLLLAAEETMQRPADTATGRLMPSLRDRRDVELDEVVWRPVLSDQGPSDLPIVVCGLDGENTFGMIRREAMPKPPDEAYATAIANLADEVVECEKVEVAGIPIVIVSGSFYAAEKVLDRELMLSLHRLFDSELLAASTPARGCLLVTGSPRDPATIAKFAAVCRARHEDAGGRAISPAVLLVERGEIAGYVRGPGDPDHEKPEKPSARAETEPAGPKKGFLRRLFGRK